MSQGTQQGTKRKAYDGREQDAIAEHAQIKQERKQERKHERQQHDEEEQRLGRIKTAEAEFRRDLDAELEALPVEVEEDYVPYLPPSDYTLWGGAGWPRFTEEKRRQLMDDHVFAVNDCSWCGGRYLRNVLVFQAAVIPTFTVDSNGMRFRLVLPVQFWHWSVQSELDVPAMPGVVRRSLCKTCHKHHLEATKDVLYTHLLWRPEALHPPVCSGIAQEIVTLALDHRRKVLALLDEHLAVLCTGVRRIVLGFLWSEGAIQGLLNVHAASVSKNAVVDSDGDAEMRA